MISDRRLQLGSLRCTSSRATSGSAHTSHPDAVYVCPLPLLVFKWQRHQWTEIERIGRVVTEQCDRCPKRRTRLRGPESDSPAPGSLDTKETLRAAPRPPQTRGGAKQSLLCSRAQIMTADDLWTIDNQNADDLE
ncbi:hypothetical protein [Nonomuraea zeae]|uniref:Uncharacterized protein n=1 Tax=Nonomuraea zeae TaxID=1642303 RepID=A0A5S4H3V1_9ACTN|nr:hypothetical protein [Nonomuraea zeae]TMR39612.1 hypothetical protein ETD85_00950 [Nonomuraea zeae]